MLKKDEWIDYARKLNWTFSYAKEEEVFPEEMTGARGSRPGQWKNWDEPYKTTYAEYVQLQSQKESDLQAIAEALGHPENYQNLHTPWSSSLKLYAATFPLAEFAATVGNLKAVRFGLDSAWRMTATYGALDEYRHTQIPLMIMHNLLQNDIQFDWTHKFYHSNHWVALAGRHLVDELFLGANTIEFALATNFVFETALTNLQFIGLSSLAKDVGDHLFRKMVNSIQTDEARHSQIGHTVLRQIIEWDKEYAQYLLDKWLWRSWPLFAIVTGFSMDYFTPLAERKYSFKEFMEEWVVQQYGQVLQEFGMEKPWYWDIFLQSFDNYHHMAYVSAYSYRATLWFDMVVPSPEERAWLKRKYPQSWNQLNQLWSQIDESWRKAHHAHEWAVHGTSIIGFCDLCQIVLCGGTPQKNTVNTLSYQDKNYIFCSEPCRWIFQEEPHRYSSHLNLVNRVLAGQAPANLLEILTQYFGLSKETWGHDLYAGNYPWIRNSDAPSPLRHPEK